jgi:AcrR family transcriptional regulator
VARNTLARWTRADWIEQGLEVLRREGHEAIRVERLAAELGATKGSFYHHFGSRDELLTALWDAWRHRSLVAVLEASVEEEETLHELIVKLSHVVADQDLGRYERAIQAWSLTDDRVAKAIAKAHEERVEFVTSLFLRYGYTASQARNRARLYYDFIAASYVAGYEDPPERIRKFCSAMSRIVTEQPPAKKVSRRS